MPFLHNSGGDAIQGEAGNNHSAVTLSGDGTSASSPIRRKKSKCVEERSGGGCLYPGPNFLLQDSFCRVRLCFGLLFTQLARPVVLSVHVLVAPCHRLQDVSPAGHAGLGPRARQHVVHVVVVIDGQVISFG
jgi:hypothetical protein